MAEGDQPTDPLNRSPRNGQEDADDDDPGASTTNTPDEVRVDGSKQTLPVLKGKNPTADQVDEWSMGFEAALNIFGLREVVERTGKLKTSAS
jgi:hypothetical protein